MSVLISGIIGFLAGGMAFLATAGLVRLFTPVRTAASGVALGRARTVRFALLLGAMSAVEELVFRAGQVGLGMRIVGVSAALIGSALLFAAAHRTGDRLGLFAWINLTLVGLVLGALYLASGLAAAVGFHWSWNVWEWWSGFRVSGEKTTRFLPAPPLTRDIAGYPFGPEGHPAATLVLAAALLVLVWRARIPL